MTEEQKKAFAKVRVKVQAFKDDLKTPPIEKDVFMGYDKSGCGVYLSERGHRYIVSPLDMMEKFK